MKKIYFIFIIISIIALFVVQKIYAISMADGETNVYIEQKVASFPQDSKDPQFSQEAGYINVDSYIDYIGVTETIESSQGHEEVPELTYNNDEITVAQSFFSIFDYVPNTEITLIKPESLKDNFISIKSEGDVNLQATYNDIYGNEISTGYPKIYYKKQNSSDTWTQSDLNSTGSNIYSINLSLDYGSYVYYVVADNEKHPGEYKSPTRTFFVTENPHSFENLNPDLQDGKGNTNTILNFKWTAKKGLETDTLKYTLFLGTSENSMKQYDLETQDFYTAYNLEPQTRYYWKVEVENQYGAKLLNPEIFNFVTLGEIKKVYNAPNPFNPMIEKTRIFFEMAEDGNVDLDVYSEYADKIYHTSIYNVPKGNYNIEYAGRDDRGSVLYNGTYLCVVKKKYHSGRTQKERCRLLVIK